MLRRFEAFAGYSAAILLAVAWSAILGRSGVAGSTQEVSLLPPAVGKNTNCPTCETQAPGVEVSGIFNVSPAARNNETIDLGINVAELVNRSHPGASAAPLIQFPSGFSFDNTDTSRFGGGAFQRPWSLSPMSQGLSSQFDPTFQCYGSELCAGLGTWDLPVYWNTSAAVTPSLPVSVGMSAPQLLKTEFQTSAGRLREGGERLKGRIIR